MRRPRALRTIVALIVILIGVAVSAPTGGAVPVVNLSIWGGYPEIDRFTTGTAPPVGADTATPIRITIRATIVRSARGRLIYFPPCDGVRHRGFRGRRTRPPPAPWSCRISSTRGA